MVLPLNYGLFQYNGFTFNSTTRTNVRGKPLYDQAERTVISMIFSIQAVTIIQSATGTDATMLDAINRLSKAGQALTFTSKGFAPLLINVAGVRDTMWGPKPRVIDCRPIGGAQAWELTWVCDVAIPMCTNAQYMFAVMAFNFEIDFSIDAEGYTTRTISGYVEIPMTRVAGGSTVPDNADRYWESVQPDIPPGFRRKDRTRHLSADKRRLDYTIVDEQIPGGGFPPGIVAFEGSHNIANAPNNWTKFHSTITATYTVAPGTPKSVASAAFFALLMDRVRPLKDKGRLFHGFSVTEGLGTNRKINFSCSYSFVSNIVDCMADGGFGAPVPNTNWDIWIASDGVRQAQSARGSAGMQFFSSDDAIIDLCTNRYSGLQRRGKPELYQLVSGPQFGIATGVTPEQSWLKYKVKITVISKSNTTRIKYLPTAQPSNNGLLGIPALLGIPGYGNNVSKGPGGIESGLQNAIRGSQQTSTGQLTNEQNMATDAIQVRSSRTYHVILEGYAIRAAYKIPLPQLVTFGGVAAIPATQWATTDIPIANWSGIPVYARQFRLEYDLAEPPGKAKLTIPGNPAIQVDE